MTPLELLDDALEAPGYRPGVCNIGPAEMTRRRWIGVAGLTASAAMAAGLLAVDAPPVLRLAVAMPLWGGILSLMQARRRFCVGFAVAGLWNLGPAGERQRVTDRADHAADLRRSAVMLGQAAIPAWLIAVAFAASPI